MKAATGLTMVVVTSTLLAYWGPVTPALGYPPDPDNAALLYYQAFLLIPQTDDRAVTNMVNEVANGAIAPNDQVKEYIKKGRDAIECAVAATELSHCNWGLRYSKGFSAAFPHLAQVRSLARLIVAEGRILAAQGDYRPALERCLAVHRLAGHIGDETLISFLVSVAVSAQANKGLTSILEQMPVEVGTLTWLKGQLVAAPVATLTPNRSMALEREVSLASLQPGRVEELAPALAQESGLSVEEIRRHVDEPTLARAREYYTNFVDSALAVLSSSMPYAQAYPKLQELAGQIEQAAARDPAAKLVKGIAPALTRIYVLQLRHRADVNALHAAVDLYLAKATTGQLPPRLPVASPRDPYTGNEFQYEPAANGFVLRCGAKDLEKNEVQEYRFPTK